MARIEAMILAGEYAPGDPLPSEHEIIRPMARPATPTLIPLCFSNRVCQVGISELPVVEAIDWNSDDAELRHLLSIQVRGIVRPVFLC